MRWSFASLGASAGTAPRCYLRGHERLDRSTRPARHQPPADRRQSRGPRTRHGNGCGAASCPRSTAVRSGRVPGPGAREGLGAMGFLGCSSRARHARPNASPTARRARVEAGDSGLRSFVSVTSRSRCFAILTFGSDEQRGEWLPRLTSGDAIDASASATPTPAQRPGLDAHVGPARRRRRGAQRHEDVVTNGSVSDVAIVGQTPTRACAGSRYRAIAPGSARPTSTRRCRFGRASQSSS